MLAEHGNWNTQGTFKLWCNDLRPTSVLLNKENDVVAVIDWEFAYFAPTSFSHDPPWWAILGKVELWNKGIDDFYAEFDRQVLQFTRAMELEEGRYSLTRLLAKAGHSIPCFGSISFSDSSDKTASAATKAGCTCSRRRST